MRDCKLLLKDEGRQVTILLYVGNRQITTKTTCNREEQVRVISYLRGENGTSGGGFTHTQSSPSDTWIINHNLGYRPSVELIDIGGLEIEGEVQHLSLNQTVVRFNVATAGFARLN